MRLLASVFLGCIFVSLKGFPDCASKVLKNTTSIQFVSCCNPSTGIYNQNLVPSPYRCERFYICEPILSNGRIVVGARLQECPKDVDGQDLYYDYQKCRCLRQNEAVCYDPSNETLDFFNCATPFEEEGLSNKC